MASPVPSPLPLSTPGAEVRSPAVVVRVAERLVALPVAHVVETMRPLPIEPLAGMPALVRGMAIVRGRPTPVLALSAWWGDGGGSGARFVVVRVPGGQAALLVDDVLGVFPFPDAPWLEAAAGPVEAIGVLSDQLLSVVAAARLVPDDQWPAVLAAATAAGGPS